MIEVLKYPPVYCFAGNPVEFVLKSDSSDPIELVVSHNGENVRLFAYPYKSGDSYQASRDISGVLRSFFSERSLYGDTLAIAPYPDLIRECRVTVADQEYTIKAMDGGVSHSAIIELQEYGEDIFTYRLNNAERSLLFTTRTNSSTITLRESELFPFVFLHPGKTIYFVSGENNTITEAAMEAGTPCLMDLSYIRQLFFEIYDEQTSTISIEVDGIDSFEVVLTPGRWSEDMCWLIFRNSLGVFERIEIAGKGYHTPELSEDKGYQQHLGSGIFKQKRERLEIQDIITIQTGYLNQEELEFVKDLVATDQAYLVYPDKRIVECIPSIDNFKYAMRITEPTSLELKLHMVHKDKYHTPKISIGSPDAFVWDGVWDDYGRWFDNREINDYKNS